MATAKAAMSKTTNRFRKRNPWRNVNGKMVCQATAHEWGLYEVRPWPAKEIASALNTLITLLIDTERKTGQIDAFQTMLEICWLLSVFFDEDEYRPQSVIAYLKLHYDRKSAPLRSSRTDV